MPKIYKFKSEFEKTNLNCEKNKIHEGRHVNKSGTLVSLCQDRLKKNVYLFTTRLNGTYGSLEKSFDSQYCILKINRSIPIQQYFSYILNTFRLHSFHKYANRSSKGTKFMRCYNYHKRNIH